MSDAELDYVQDLPPAPTPPSSIGIEVARSRSAMDSFPTLVFDSVTLGRLANPRKLLDGSAVNGCAAILYSMFPRNSTAIFNSLDLTRMLDGMPDDHLWRNTKRTEFWTKDLWIIPIHRPQEVHWTVACVCVSRRSIEVFDSLAIAQSTSQDLQVRMLVIYLVTVHSLMTFKECLPVCSSTGQLF